MSRPEGVREAISRLSAPDRQAWQPLFFDARDSGTEARLLALLREQPGIACVDTIETQLRDLARTQLKDKTAPEARIEDTVREILAGASPSEFGGWVYYPWRRQLVHLLPEAAFRELRLDRNQHKITRAEQQVLLSKSIVIVGLSVGSSALTTLALEGVGGQFRIADFDGLDLSNLNRLRASVLDLGVNKAVLAARAVLEIDPYLDVQLFSEGVSEGNLDALFSPRPDLLIEECDDLPMKVRLRERARVAGIPVLMETTDRGMLDIERFDLEPGRPLFHGRVGDVDAASLRQASNRERVPFVLGILDDQRISTRLAASLVEIEKTVYTWPQLASAVSLGGALVSHAARHLLLGTHDFSGRFYVDLDQLISAERAMSVASGGAAGAAGAASCAEPVCPALPAGEHGVLSPELARFLVEHAARAPSGGNAQPWSFRFASGMLECELAAERAESFLDFMGQASELALGAAVENINVAAECLGYELRVLRRSRPAEPFARLELERKTTPRDSALRQAIFERVTRRHRLAPAPLEASQSGELMAQAEALGMSLRLEHEPARLHQLGALLGAADRIRFQNERYHAELMSELRWTRAEAERTRTGIDVASLEASDADLAGLRILKRRDVSSFLEREALGESLEDSARKSLAACSAVGLLSVPDGVGAFDAGRRLQRLWLHSTLRELAWHPWTAFLPMYARARADQGLPPAHRASLLRLGARLMDLWQLPAAHSPLFIFRVLVRPPPPRARALRLGIDAILAGA